MSERMISRISDPDDLRIAAFRDIRERDLVGREGRFIAEGRVVLNVLAGAAHHSLESLLVLENRLAGAENLIARLPDDVCVFVASQDVMDAVTGFHVHRGLIGIGRRRIEPDMADFLANLPNDALVVVLSGISNHDNMGAIFRNAAAFEAEGVIMDGQCCDPLYRKAIRVSVGAALQVPFVRARSLSDICAQLAQNRFVLGALSPGGASPIGAFPKTGRRALILGAEGEGLAPETLHKLGAYKIPMSDNFDSLNVAAAAAVALFHASRFSS